MTDKYKRGGYMKNNKVQFLVGAIFSLSERRNGLRTGTSARAFFQRR